MNTPLGFSTPPTTIRARCGSGSYFNPGHFYDHWICEYGNAVQARWVRVDAQIDDVQRAILKIDFDVLEVPLVSQTYGEKIFTLLQRPV